MTSLNTEQSLLKSDTRGRVRVPREQREAALAEFETSGVSAAQFARMAGIKYQTFIGWVAKERRARLGRQREEEERDGNTKKVVANGPVRLFEAVVGRHEIELGGRSDVVGLVVELPGGGRVRVESALQVRLTAELLRQLAAGGTRPC